MKKLLWGCKPALIWNNRAYLNCHDWLGRLAVVIVFTAKAANIDIRDRVKWCAAHEKGPHVISGQRKPRSACAFAQADLGLRCPLTKSIDIAVYVDKQKNTYIRLHGCASLSGPSLLAYGIRASFTRCASNKIRTRVARLSTCTCVLAGKVLYIYIFFCYERKALFIECKKVHFSADKFQVTLTYTV